MRAKLARIVSKRLKELMVSMILCAPPHILHIDTRDAFIDMDHDVAQESSKRQGRPLRYEGVRVRFDQLVLLRVEHVSKGSLQPIVGVRLDGSVRSRADLPLPPC